MKRCFHRFIKQKRPRNETVPGSGVLSLLLGSLRRVELGQHRPGGLILALEADALLVAGDTGQILGDLLELLEGIALHHADGLHQGRAAAMDAGNSLSGLEGVAELVLHHAHDAMGVLGGPGGIPDDVLVAQLAHVVLFHVEVGLGGQGSADAAGEVGHDLILVVDVVTSQTAAGVGQDLIGNLLAGGELLAAVGGALAGSEDQLSGLDDVAQLVADMALLGDVVDLGHQSGLGGDDLGDGGLAAGVGVAVIVGEHQGQVAGVAANALVLQAVHEDAAVGNEHIVKDGQGFHVADLGEGSLDEVALVVLAGQRHELDAVPVGGQREGNGVVGGPRCP